MGAAVAGATVLLVLLAAAAPVAPDAGNGTSSPQAAAAACPIAYERHTAQELERGVLPYLLGGVFERSECVNCKRGGLWSSWCSFKPTGLDFWDRQQCTPQQLRSFVNSTLASHWAEALRLTPCDLWPYLKGRTTWIIGDSMSRDLFRALRCFMLEFQSLSTFHASNNFTAMHLLSQLPGDGQPWCALLLNQTRICQVHAVQGQLFVGKWQHGERSGPGVLNVLHDSLAVGDDLFILHFGLWHRTSRRPEYRTHLHEVGRFYAATKATFPHVWFMETPKQHFDSEDGDYVQEWTGVRKGPFTCQPVKGLGVAPDGSLTAEKGNVVAEYVAGGAWRNAEARAVLRQYGLPLLPVYNSTAAAWQFHRSNFAGQECSHFCFPSAPQLWLWELDRALAAAGVQPVAEWPRRRRNKGYGCATVHDRDESLLGKPKPYLQVAKEIRGRKEGAGGGSEALPGAARHRDDRGHFGGGSGRGGDGGGGNAKQPLPSDAQQLKDVVQQLREQNEHLLKLLQQHRAKQRHKRHLDKQQQQQQQQKGEQQQQPNLERQRQR